MIFFHNVFDLIEILLGKFITVFKNSPDLVVDSVKRVEIFFLEVPLLSLVSQQGNLVSYLLIVFHRYLHPTIIQIEQLQQLKGNFAIFALITRSDIFVLTVSTDLFLLKISIRLHCTDHRSSFHIVPPYSGQFFLLILLFIHVLLSILIVESNGLIVSVIDLIIQHLTLFHWLLLCMCFYVLHYLRKDLLFYFLGVVRRKVQSRNQFF